MTDPYYEAGRFLDERYFDPSMMSDRIKNRCMTWEVWIDRRREVVKQNYLWWHPGQDQYLQYLNHYYNEEVDV